MARDTFDEVEDGRRELVRRGYHPTYSQATGPITVWVHPKTHDRLALKRRTHGGYEDWKIVRAPRG